MSTRTLSLRLTFSIVALAGWGSTIGMMLADDMPARPWPTIVVVVGATGTTLLGLSFMLGAVDPEGAYRLGVEVGRAEALRAMNPPATVTPLRAAPGGITQFNRTVSPRSARGHRARPARLGSSPAERADSRA